MPTSLRFIAVSELELESSHTIFVGRKDRLTSAAVRELLPEPIGALWESLVEDIKPGSRGASATTHIAGPSGLRKISACVVPEAYSRHNSPSRPDALGPLVTKAAGKGQTHVICALEDAGHALAAGVAIARGLPLFDAKSADDSNSDGDAEVAVAFLAPDDGDISLNTIDAVAKGVRRAARLVDTPTSELNTNAFVQEAYQVAELVGADIEVISADQLDQRGFGGLWGVGKAAVHKPALVILSHQPEGATESVAWVGKGIVYDTGGLSIKGKAHMPGMKQDMAGAAAVLGAFEAAVTNDSVTCKLYALLCLAENSVGPEATRPDDILHMYSGKTVEVNNTDAEGRLVLADGVAYATRHLSPSVVVDIATLTGAQLVATGKKHAGGLCSDDALEARAVEAGKRTGDLVHPLPYCPEFFQGEFKSKVADMKNSVKDSMNAPSSCAGHFVGSHLAEDYLDNGGRWLHLDIAGPSGSEERGTGFGVALLHEMFRS